MTRILHTADLHIGCCKSYPGYLTRGEALVKELLRLVKRKKCDYLVIAGDFFDRSSPGHHERALVADLFFKCPVPIISIVGNHDRWGREMDQTALNWLTHLATRSGHRVWDTPTAEKVGDVWWVAIPSGSWTQSDMYLLTNWLVDQVPRDEGPVVALAHEFFYGAATDTGYTRRGTRPKIPAHERIQYWALGDIHKFQKMATNAWYPGSPYQIQFGEQLPKGVLIKDIDDRWGKPEFVPIKTPRPLVELTEVPETWPRAFVKLTVRPEEIPHPLPSCVVTLGTAAGRSTEEAAMELANASNENYFLDGLDAYLTKKGFKGEKLERALEFAGDLVKKI